jgi:hypothetical protein
MIVNMYWASVQIFFILQWQCPMIVRNLLHSAVHRVCLICHSCYLLLYRQSPSQRNDWNASRNDATMDVDSANGISYSHKEIATEVDGDWCCDQLAQATDTSSFSVNMSHWITSVTNFSLFRSIYSHEKCSACKMIFSSNQSCRGSVITGEARFDASLNHHILFHSRSRCCSIHLTKGLVNKSAMNMITGREK